MHYGLPVRSRARTEDLVGAVLKRGWTLDARVWRHRGDPPLPPAVVPADGRAVVHFPQRDRCLDEYCRTEDAHRRLHALRHGLLGGDQIAVFSAAYGDRAYGERHVTDSDLAGRLGKHRSAVTRARGRAQEHILGLALADYEAEIRVAIKSQ